MPYAARDLLRAVIVDADTKRRDALRARVTGRHDVHVAAEAAGAEEGVCAIVAERPDLIVLAAELGALDCVDVLLALPPLRISPVLFVCSDHSPVEPMLLEHDLPSVRSPIEPSKFEELLRQQVRLIRQRQTKGSDSRISAFLSAMRGQGRTLRLIVVRSRRRNHFLRVDDIDWISAAGDYVCYHAQQKKLLERRRISELEGWLDPRKFIRVHRSVIVRMDKVGAIEPTPRGEHVVRIGSDIRLSLSRSYRDAVLNALSRSL